MRPWQQCQSFPRTLGVWLWLQWQGRDQLAVLRDSEAEQNDIFNIKYTQGLLGLSIQDEGESETL